MTLLMRAARWFGGRTAWVLAALLTTLSGLVVGVGSPAFQLFGESPDRGDYLVGSGGYLAAAAVLGVALAGARRAGVGATAVVTFAVAAVALALAGIGSLQKAAELPPHDRPSAGVLDGVGGVVLLPWCWLLLWHAARRAIDAVRR